MATERRTRFELVVGETRLVFEGSETYVVEQLARHSADVGRLFAAAALHGYRVMIPESKEPGEGKVDSDQA